MQPFPSTGQGKPTFENISECWLGCSKARGRQNFPSTGQDKYLEMFPKVGSMARGRQNFLSTSQSKYSEMFPKVQRSEEDKTFRVLAWASTWRYFQRWVQRPKERQNFPSTGLGKYPKMFPKVGSKARGR